MTTPDFIPFRKIPRLSRDIIITEKIDGTNATIYIDNNCEVMYTASRNKWITPEDDNHGFAGWVQRNKEELLTLGPGWHRGEWWGKKIQRGYEVDDKRFSLFNTSLPAIPSCCRYVPVLYSGTFDTNSINLCLSDLCNSGSVAAPGFMKPEGIVVFHTAALSYFKKMIEGDKDHKGV